MLTVDEASAIGKEACLNKMGKEFVERHKGFATYGVGEHGERVFCFIGIDHLHRNNAGGLLLDDEPFPCRVSCNVDKKDGSVSFVEFVKPE